jgi:rSAM/selenodomain-associated transferase 1
VSKAIAIFARAPVPGEVKTRLARHIGDADAAQLYGAMLGDTIDVAQRSARANELCDVVLSHTPETAFEPGEYSLAPFWSGVRQVQCDGNLGRRMLDCISTLQGQGRQQVVLIGSDTPHLSINAITHCFDQLTRHDLHLCRTSDGGFNLIGAGAPLPDELFNNVEWSTERVFEQVASNAQALNMKWSSSFDGHDDIDTFADLLAFVQLLRAGKAHAPQTARCLHLQSLL